MALLTYIQGLGATHLFTLDNAGTSTADDKGSSGTPTNITGGNYTFATDPVCEGVTRSLDVVANTNPATTGAVFANKTDINDSPLGYASGTRTLILWCKQAEIQNPSCIYEQGGTINNFAFMGGALMTFQAADSGQPFLIVQSRSLAEAGRPYLLTGVWEYHTQHAGSGNRVLFYINGVLQGISELNGTDVFPEHAGDIACGNTLDNLQSYAGTTYESQTTGKNCNYLGMFNNVSLTQAQSREIFERSTFADVTIVADTVANQQVALDALIGNTYENTNCAIRIIQATDATNYRLFIDNITFNADANLEDISIQFVGTGILTVENTNGTVIQYTSAPPEVETTATTHTGGGSIVVVTNTQRVSADQTVTNSTATKLVFDGAGTTYTVSGGSITELENITGVTVTVNLESNAPVPTLTETSGTIVLVQNVAVSAPNILTGSRVQLYNVTKGAELDNSVVSGSYSYTANLADASVDDGDTLRIRATYQSGGTTKNEVLSTGVVTSRGLSFIDVQTDNDFYMQYNIDGSALTQFNWDSPNLEIDITDADNEILLQDVGAWYYYYITTADGIANLFGCVEWEFYNQIKINSNLCDIKLDNKKTEALLFSGGRLYRTDGTSIISGTTTGPVHIVGGTGPAAGSGTTTFNLALDPLRDSGLSLTAYVYDGSALQSTAAMTEGSSGVYSGTYDISNVADGQYSVLFNTSTRRKGHGRLFVRGNEEVTQEQFFDPNFDTVQSVAATTNNLDLPPVEQNLTAEINANEAKIDALNNISSADVKAQADQALIDYDAATGTDVTNSESNIITEVNANETKIDSVQSSVDGLNDISSADVKTQADQALTDAGVDTLTNVKPSIPI